MKDFDKGDGIAFLNTDIGLELSSGTTLICGDTYSDIPMVSMSQHLSQMTKTVFVSTEKELQEKVRAICPEVQFVSCPDALIVVLNMLSNEE